MESFFKNQVKSILGWWGQADQENFLATLKPDPKLQALAKDYFAACEKMQAHIKSKMNG